MISMHNFYQFNSFSINFISSSNTQFDLDTISSIIDRVGVEVEGGFDNLTEHDCYESCYDCNHDSDDCERYCWEKTCDHDCLFCSCSDNCQSGYQCARNQECYELDCQCDCHDASAGECDNCSDNCWNRDCQHDCSESEDDCYDQDCKHECDSDCMDCRGSDHDEVKPDSSVNSRLGNLTGEINSPAVPVSSLDRLETYLREYCPDNVDKSCGTHIHVSFNDYKHYQLLQSQDFCKMFHRACEKWYQDNQSRLPDYFLKRLREGRASNDHSYYCSPNFADTIDGITIEGCNCYPRGRSGCCRYQAVNYHAYNTHETLEFRVFHGMDNTEVDMIMSAINLVVSTIVRFIKMREAEKQLQILLSEAKHFESKLESNYDYRYLAYQYISSSLSPAGDITCCPDHATTDSACMFESIEIESFQHNSDFSRFPLTREWTTQLQIPIAS